MIVTVTLNPAVDKTIKISNLKVGEVNRVDTSRNDVGGKGINVSKTVKELGGESIALGFIGGRNGDVIKEYLDKEKIRNDFIRIAGETRTNVKVVDTANNTYTDINEPGPAIAAEEIQAIKKKILGYLHRDTILVLSGSLPAGVDGNIYNELIEEAKKINSKVIFDAEGELFSEGIKVGPYMVKPNIDELERALGIKIEDNDDLIKAAKGLLDYGIEYVVVSLGGDGSLVVGKEGCYKAKGLKVEVKSTVGAGDSMVGALALAIERGYGMEQALRLASAAGTASVMSEGTQSGKREVIHGFMDKIEITPL